MNMVFFGSLVWLVPLWILGVGGALGLAALGVLAGGCWVLRRSAAEEVVQIVREGILFPASLLALVLAAFAAVTTPLVPYGDLLSSAMRFPFVRNHHLVEEIPPETLDYQLPLELHRDEIRRLEFRANGDLMIEPVNEAGEHDKEFSLREVLGGAPVSWRWTPTAESLLRENASGFAVSNLGGNPVSLEILVENSVPYPEVALIGQTALALVVLFALYFALRLAFPKLMAVALATSKEGMGQPLFYVVMSIGAFLLLCFIYIPYNTFGEDVKMLKDSGLTLIMLFGILVGLWTASISIAEEIEGRTALTVLSKPVGRRQFLLGKFLGVIGPVCLVFLFLGVLFLATVSYKVVYDAREAAKLDPTWRECYVELVGTLPGLALAFMESVVMAAISVAVATRLPLLANLVICLSVYALGHLVPRLVMSTAEGFEIVAFMARFFATVLPVLDYFNIQAAIAAGAEVPLVYLGGAALYCLLYTTAAMLLALVLFEGRDVA